MLVLFPSKKLKNESVTLLCTNFLNSLEEKITAHSGLTYLIRFTNYISRGEFFVKK